jgi:hypothetical protein
MNLFWLLILAHFIADFPLQSDKVYALKAKNKWGLLPHIFISVITNVLVGFPFLRFENFWFTIIFLAFTHYSLDWLKIILTKNYLSDSMFTFLLDQALHIFFIWFTCFHIFHIPVTAIENSIIQQYFFNRQLILSLIGLVFSIFAGGVLIHYIRRTVYHLKTKHSAEQVLFPDVNNRRIGYIERFFSTFGTIFGGWLLLLVPIAFIPRIIVQVKFESREFLIINFVAGLIISVGAGLFVRLMC